MSKKKNEQKKTQIILTIISIICLIVAYYYSEDIKEILNKTSIAVKDTTTYSSIEDIPEYKGEIYVEINDNKPYFNENEYTTKAFEKYSQLDNLGRCGVAYANICKEIMPTEARKSISDVYPTGWIQAKYNGEYLYNRCHLIGHQLAGEDANKLNLITGTRYFNVTGMLPFENKVSDYIKENTSNHVLYRVTPDFKNENKLASGVEIEAFSVEDKGNGICFNIYIYNVQPGITIDYKTGESR